MNGNEFELGDRVVVSGGYDGATSKWLQGGDGYSGTLVEIAGPAAVVELDDELILSGSWQDFGEGSRSSDSDGQRGPRPLALSSAGLGRRNVDQSHRTSSRRTVCDTSSGECHSARWRHRMLGRVPRCDEGR